MPRLHRSVRRAGLALCVLLLASSVAVAQNLPPGNQPLPPPPPPPGPMMQQGQQPAPPPPSSTMRERHPALRDAAMALRRAREALEHAEKDFGGHRTRAIQYIDGALAEVRAAMQMP